MKRCSWRSDNRGRDYEFHVLLCIFRLIVFETRPASCAPYPGHTLASSVERERTGAGEYELAPEGEGTRLLFTHRDLPTKESAESHSLGWDHYHERLAVAAAGGDPGPDPWLTERS